MPRAYNLIRLDPHYRHSAFTAGLLACGYQVVTHPPVGDIARDDVLVIWNRYGTNDAIARRFEAVGAQVLVAENPYIKQDDDGAEYFALALGHHNGFGRWPTATPLRAARFASKFQGMKPWRKNGKHVLILAQRGIGEPGVASPPDMLERAATMLRLHTKRAIVVRGHPGNKNAPPPPPIGEQLVDCWAVVTWASSAAVQCILSGIPAFHMAEWCAWGTGGCDDLTRIEQPPLPDRRLMLQEVISQQWAVADIESGAAFKAILS